MKTTIATRMRIIWSQNLNVTTVFFTLSDKDCKLGHNEMTFLLSYQVSTSSTIENCFFISLFLSYAVPRGPSSLKAALRGFNWQTLFTKSLITCSPTVQLWSSYGQCFLSSVQMIKLNEKLKLPYNLIYASTWHIEDAV